MEKIIQSGPWLGRLVLLAVTILFIVIGFKVVGDPLQVTSDRGIALASPMAFTTMRVAGAFPLATGVITFLCLLSLNRIVPGLAFLAIMDGIVLLVRVYSALVDHSISGENIRIIGVETIVLFFSLAALFLELERRRLQINKAQS